MEIKINVDDAKFAEVIKKELDAFSKEEMHDIIRDMIVEGFRTNDVLKSFFTVQVNNSSWGTTHTTTEAGELLKDAAKTFDLSECFQEIQQSMIDEIKNNHKDIVEKVMLDMILCGISNNYDFTQRMSYQVEQIIRQRNNN